jgi:hypothetical protein
MLMAAGTREGGLNPMVSSSLWRKIGIPKFLYGSELWQLKMKDYIVLEKVQNIMVRIMQGLLPGTSGSAARGLLGLLSIEAVIDKQKLYFLGRLVNMGAGAPCRRVFFIRLLRWKWNYGKKLTGFVPDIVEILAKYDLLEVLITYILTNDFPIKTQPRKPASFTCARAPAKTLVPSGHVNPQILGVIRIAVSLPLREEWYRGGIQERKRKNLCLCQWKIRPFTLCINPYFGFCRFLCYLL